jgi:hypothetical protein
MWPLFCSVLSANSQSHLQRLLAPGDLGLILIYVN